MTFKLEKKVESAAPEKLLEIARQIMVFHDPHSLRLPRNLNEEVTSLIYKNGFRLPFYPLKISIDFENTKENTSFVIDYLKDYFGIRKGIYANFLEGNNKGEGVAVHYSFNVPLFIETFDSSREHKSIREKIYWECIFKRKNNGKSP